MVVLLLLGKISAIKLSGIGAGGAVILGQIPILLVSTKRAMRITELSCDFFILSPFQLTYHDA